ADALERQGPDALRTGRIVLRPPRLPLAGDRGRRLTHQTWQYACGEEQSSFKTATARSDHSRRAAPDQRPARNPGRPVRDGLRQALLVKGEGKAREAEGDRSARDDTKRGRSGLRAFFAQGNHLPAARTGRARQLLFAPAPAFGRYAGTAIHWH